MGETSSEQRRSNGRRAVDDGARLLIAENALVQVEKQFATLADGQDVLSGVLIGRPHKDGTVTIGLVAQVEQVRNKQNETGSKVDAIIADVGDVKCAQAEQAQVLVEHGHALERIEVWFALGVRYLKAALDWAGRGLATLIGVGILHLLTLWWPAIVNYFTGWSSTIDVAMKGHH